MPLPPLPPPPLLPTAPPVHPLRRPKSLDNVSAAAAARVAPRITSSPASATSLHSTPANPPRSRRFRNLPPLPSPPPLLPRLLRPRTRTRSLSLPHSRSRSQHKAETYAKELDRARLKGEWTSTHLGSAKNLPWSELLRKYLKHNPNETITAAVASIEHQLRAALVNFYRDEEYTDASHEQDDALPQSKTKTLFPPSVPTNRQGDGWSGPQFEGTSAQLEEQLTSAGSHDVMRQAITAIQAYALFALGKDEEAVAFLHDSRFLETVNTDQMRPEEQAQEYQTALFLLGFVTYGLCNERLHYARPTAGYLPFALAGYARAIDLHEQVRGGKRASALPGLPEDEIENWAETALYRNALLSVREGDFSLGLNAVRAYQAHVIRWPSDFRLPQRNVVNRVYLALLNQSVHSGLYVPPPSVSSKSQDDWRSQAYQRSVVAAVAARVKIRDFEAERPTSKQQGAGDARRIRGIKGKITSRTTSTRRPDPHRAVRPTSTLWSNEVLTASRSASLTVERSSEFPRAGKINRSALLLSDELVRSWQLNGEQGGEHADDLVESLYVLTRLTFHSQRISRHLFSALVAAQNFPEARKALELYASIVDKARQGDAAGSASLVEESKIREREQQEQGYDLEEVKKKEKEEEDKPLEEREQQDRSRGLSEQAKKRAGEVLLDADDDATYITTLLKGAHVLVKYLNDPVAANAMASKALKLIPIKREQDKLAANKEHLARALRVAGQCRAALIAAHPDPARLTKLQQEALSLLKQSLELDDQSSEAWYQLAYLQAELRDVAAAIPSVRRAIELEPADVQSWHLLTLLVSAQKDSKAAFRIAEVALDEADEDDEKDSQAVLRSALLGNSNDAAMTTTQAENPKTNGTHHVGVARTALLSVDFPPTSAERAESILQLMMTQNALEEAISGTDIAIESQRDTFQFFHDRLSRRVQTGRPGVPAAAAANRNVAAADNGAALQSISGMGQSGSTVRHRDESVGQFASTDKMAAAAAAAAPSLRPLSSGNGGPVAAVVPSSIASNGVGGASKGGRTQQPSYPSEGEKQAPSATLAEGRAIYQTQKEIHQLCSLWLMSAATFRRAGRLGDARNAIQEAELVDPGRSEVWTQLALSTESTDVKMAIGSLYKALACQADNVAASVHLARMFLDHGDAAIGAAAAAAKDRATASSSSGTAASHDVRDGAGAAALDDSTLDRSISGTTKPNSRSPGARDGQFASSAEAQTSPAARSLSGIALAEGLLVATTAGLGWDAAEAWLYLARVHQRTQRRQRARECLKYALELEETKSIRPLSIALAHR